LTAAAVIFQSDQKSADIYANLAVYAVIIEAITEARVINDLGNYFQTLLIRILQNPNLLQVPFLAGAVVPFYRLSTLQRTDPPIVFDRAVLTDIFRGVITRWNDPRLVADNTAIADKLPNEEITVVLRYI
jgi:phosphate transport system substrate-binding protein